MSDGVRYNDRTLVLGQTGSGKSELLNHQFTAIRCQKVLVDCNDEWRIDGAEEVRRVDAIDWSAPVIHYTAETGDRDEYDELFAAAFRRRNLVMCVHELGDLCEFEASRTPRHVRAYLSKGRTHGLGSLGASQRPVEMPKRGRTEVQHVFLFVPRFEGDDLGAVAKILGMPEREVGERQDQLHTEHGDHSFLWFNKGTREIISCKPLPEHVRSRTIVHRRSVT